MKICKNKNCPKAGEKQPLDNFYKQRGSRDGLQHECKACVNERNKENHFIRRMSSGDGFYDMFIGGRYF